MRALCKFLALSSSDRCLIVTSATVLAGIWIGLRLFSFGKVLERVDKFSAPFSDSKRGAPHSRDRIVWAVSAVSRYAPLNFSCLVQALSAKIALGRQGYPVTVRIGVAPAGCGKLSAHAWLESNGEVVIGGKCRHDFSPLPSLNRERS